MAFEIEYLTDFTAVIAPKMVEAGMAVLEPELKKSLDEAIGSNLKQKSRSTKQLQNSVRTSHPFHENKGNRFKANVYFDGTRKSGFRNGEVAAYKEHGVESHGQDASNFIKKIISKTKKQVENAMHQVMDNELGTD